MLNVQPDELVFPRGLNLNILSTIIPKGKLLKLLMDYADKPRTERRIVLPSHKTIRKIYSHFVYKKILSGDLSWDEFKRDLKKDIGSIKALGFSKHNVKKFYLQRQKEVERESK